MTEWSARRTRTPAVPGSSPALATCWICSRSSRVQILGHACKIANWLPPASWGFKSCYLFSKYLLIVKRFGLLRERRYILLHAAGKR